MPELVGLTVASGHVFSSPGLNTQGTYASIYLVGRNGGGLQACGFEFCAWAPTHFPLKLNVQCVFT